MVTGHLCTMGNLSQILLAFFLQVQVCTKKQHKTRVLSLGQTTHYYVTDYGTDSFGIKIHKLDQNLHPMMKAFPAQHRRDYKDPLYSSLSFMGELSDLKFVCESSARGYISTVD